MKIIEDAYKYLIENYRKGFQAKPTNLYLIGLIANIQINFQEETSTGIPQFTEILCKNQHRETGGCISKGRTVFGGKAGISLSSTCLAILAWLEKSIQYKTEITSGMKYIMTYFTENWFGTAEQTALAVWTITKYYTIFPLFLPTAFFSLFIDDMEVENIVMNESTQNPILKSFKITSKKSEESQLKAKLALKTWNESYFAGSPKNIHFPISMEINYVNAIAPNPKDTNYLFKLIPLSDKVKDNQDATLELTLTYSSKLFSDPRLFTPRDEKPKKIKKVASGILVAAINLPHGCMFVKEKLDILVIRKFIKDYQIINNLEALLFFNHVPVDTTINFKLDVRTIFPGIYLSKASYIYEYSNPKNKAWASPLKIEIYSN